MCLKGQNFVCVACCSSGLMYVITLNFFYFCEPFQTHCSKIDFDAFQEYDVSEYPQRVGRQKHLLDIDIHFADSRRGTRGRGRGGPRGGGRGGPRGVGGPPRNGTPGSRVGGSGDARGPGVGTFSVILEDYVHFRPSYPRTE